MMKNCFKILTICLCGLAVFVGGCSSAEDEKNKANEAYRAEFKANLDTLRVVDKQVFTAADRGDIVNGDIVTMMKNLKRMVEMTEVEFFSHPVTDVDGSVYTEEYKSILTRSTGGFIPLYFEDEVSGNVYFAPAAEQEFIIKKWKDWYEKNGQNFDYHKVLTPVPEKK